MIPPLLDVVLLKVIREKNTCSGVATLPRYFCLPSEKVLLNSKTKEFALSRNKLFTFRVLSSEKDLLKRKEFAPLGKKFFTFRVLPSEKALL